jgi:hypothetical protein
MPAELSVLELEDLLKGNKAPHEVIPKLQRRLATIINQALLMGRKIDALGYPAQK